MSNYGRVCCLVRKKTSLFYNIVMSFPIIQDLQGSQANMFLFLTISTWKCDPSNVSTGKDSSSWRGCRYWSDLPPKSSRQSCWSSVRPKDFRGPDKIEVRRLRKATRREHRQRRICGHGAPTKSLEKINYLICQVLFFRFFGKSVPRVYLFWLIWTMILNKYYISVIIS